MHDHATELHSLYTPREPEPAAENPSSREAEAPLLGRTITMTSAGRDCSPANLPPSRSQQPDVDEEGEDHSGNSKGPPASKTKSQRKTKGAAPASAEEEDQDEADADPSRVLALLIHDHIGGGNSTTLTAMTSSTEWKRLLKFPLKHAGLKSLKSKFFAQHADLFWVKESGKDVEVCALLVEDEEEEEAGRGVGDDAGGAPASVADGLVDDLVLPGGARGILRFPEAVLPMAEVLAILEAYDAEAAPDAEEDTGSFSAQKWTGKSDIDGKVRVRSADSAEGEEGEGGKGRILEEDEVEATETDVGSATAIVGDAPAQGEGLAQGEAPGQGDAPAHVETEEELTCRQLRMRMTRTQKRKRLRFSLKPDIVKIPNKAVMKRLMAELE